MGRAKLAGPRAAVLRRLAQRRIYFIQQRAPRRPLLHGGDGLAGDRVCPPARKHGTGQPGGHDAAGSEHGDGRQRERPGAAKLHQEADQ
ncbi:hypothetical protein JT327_gp55 [Aeromonas phage LAh_7]|uniref:Uncharacterized protein n=1 Tax=Aeromonas phage LAh_7 TaxID=2591031 RepID=A0A514A0E5_9CAUD|nr:hypothetical protein JT327_gp55 [Aeromonas phage LAh_7]QDH46705.1 hypothetical protein LAh7_55 [Aeromonas phage LAh_7]